MLNQSSAQASTGAAASNNGILDFERPLLRIQREIAELESRPAGAVDRISKDIKEMRARLASMTKRIYAKLTPWETVMVARHPQRPLTTDYINMIVHDFCELHGDRTFGDDRAIITGFGRIAGHKVMLVGHNKGKDTKERMACNFGCAHPEGYRKSLAKMKLAANYGVPIVSFIDTQGAYPGIGAEERGIAQAIAVNLMEISRLPVPIVCVVIGEGGSGGALGVGVGDRVAMFEHAFYSVISPEGCAAILWRTGEQRKLAAESLKLTAKELKKLDLVDAIVPEPVGGAHSNPQAAALNLERYIGQSLRELKRVRTETLLKRRYERLRTIGSFFEDASAAKKTPARSTASLKSRTIPAATRTRTTRQITTAASGR